MSDSRPLLAMVQRGWWIVVLAALGALNIGLLSYYFSSPVYRATSSLIITPTAELTDNREMVDSIDTLDKRSIVSTYAEILSSDSIFRQATAELQLDPDVIEGYNIRAVVLPDTNVLQLATTGPDAQITAAVTNAVSIKAIEYIDTLSQIYEVSVLDSASVPGSPIRPRPMQDISLAVGIGLIIGIVLAFLYTPPITRVSAARG